MNRITFEKFCQLGLRTAGWSLLIVAVGAVSGCTSRGDTGPNANAQFPGVFQPDLHGDSPLLATRIIPDSGSILAAINQPGDVDWFKYTAVQGVTYTIQAIGFNTQFPDIQDPNNNQTRDYELIVNVFAADSSTHLPNSSGISGMYADLPSGFEASNLLLIGDSRFLFVPPTTGTYFFRVSHNRLQVGTANYQINLATSQFGQTIPIVRNNWRAAVVPRDPMDTSAPPFIFNHFVQASSSFQFDVSDESVFTSFFVEDVHRMEFMDMVYQFAEDPESQEVHIHVGNPNLSDMFQNRNITDGMTDHNIAITLVPVARRTAESRADGTSDPSAAAVTEFMMPTEDGGALRVPAWGTSDPATAETQVRVDLSRAGTRQGTTIQNSGVRLVVGFPWYVDAHYTDDFAADPVPVVASGLLGDAYSVFEAELVASPNNLTREQQARIPAGYFSASRELFENSLASLRTTRQSYSAGIIRYDAALQAFMLNDRLLDGGSRPSDPTPVPPGQATDIRDLNLQPQVAQFLIGDIPVEFVGLQVDVHSGGIGQDGPLMFTLGTMPAPDLPPGVIGPDPYTGFTEFAIFGPNFPFDAIYSESIFNVSSFPVPYQDKTIIRKLTNPEVQALRAAFYSGGFHILIKDQNNNNTPIARAEGIIGINLTPNDPGPGDFRGGYHANKGTVRFVSQYRGGAITVIANGEIIGELTEAVGAVVPECGDDAPGAVVSTELLPDEYAYRAFAEDGTEWEGLFTVDGLGSCNTIVLAPDI